MRVTKRRIVGAVLAATAAVGSLAVGAATPAYGNHFVPGRGCHALAETNPVAFQAAFGTGSGAQGRCARSFAQSH